MKTLFSCADTQTCCMLSFHLQLYDKQSFFASCVLKGLNLPYLNNTLGLSEEENPLLRALAFRFFYSVLNTDAPF